MQALFSELAHLSQAPSLGGVAGVGLEPAPPPVEPTNDSGKARGNKSNAKDMSQFDIRPGKIKSGEDIRTTVTVRNLTGPSARADFLKFLACIGLEEKYTFFYMPCKEHRNIHA